MNQLAQLLADCDTAGVRLIPTGPDQLKIDAPQAALTPELIERLKTQKASLLQILKTVRQDIPDQEAWPETIDGHALEPCPKCGTLELWETLVGNWRCLRCDPPTRWRKFAAKHCRQRPT
ncbi:hypothetical protein [Bremerella cremea]|uniref:TubC N-terminal docking domain-related protein n=1 Tax=Bremerella cremea TaxID=1031537 RepID=UPI0031E9CEE8